MKQDWILKIVATLLVAGIVGAVSLSISHSSDIAVNSATIGENARSINKIDERMEKEFDSINRKLDRLLMRRER